MYQERIRDIYEHLSPGYRRIADFLLKSYQQAAFMTAAEVGRASDVDTTLVVRFAQRLGYPGFPELIGDIQDDVKRDLRAVYAAPEEDTSPLGIVRRNLTQDRNNLEYMLLHMDADVFQKALDALSKASRIFVTGEGAAIHIGEAFVSRLVMSSHAAFIVSNEPAAQAATAALLKPSDVVVGFGSTLLTPSVAAMLKVSRKAGAKTIGIVGSISNPAASVAEIVIVAPTLTQGPVPTWTSMAAVAHSLIQALATPSEEHTGEWAERTEQLLDLYTETWRNRAHWIKETLEDYNTSPSA